MEIIKILVYSMVRPEWGVELSVAFLFFFFFFVQYNFNIFEWMELSDERLILFHTSLHYIDTAADLRSR